MFFLLKFHLNKNSGNENATIFLLVQMMRVFVNFYYISSVLVEMMLSKTLYRPDEEFSVLM